MKSHLVIPDTQCKPGVPLDHLYWAGLYAADKRPDVIIHLGDHWDMPSLSTYELVDHPEEHYRQDYQADLDAGDRGLDEFDRGLKTAPRYNPRKILLGGNHDWGRYFREIRKDPRKKGLRPPWEYAKKLGWEVKPFLVPTVVDGITYCHYFNRGENGLVFDTKKGAPSARAMVRREMKSCVAGHKPGLDVHIQPVERGMVRGVIAGSFYQHDEVYPGPQGNFHWRGILMLHEVHNGNFCLMEVSLDYLRRRFGRSTKRAA